MGGPDAKCKSMAVAGSRGLRAGPGVCDAAEGSSKPVEITGERKSLRSFCFGGACMSDMNVRPPEEGERVRGSFCLG
jgi:hypothetical protein